MIYLLHHAEAVDASVDPQRPLSPGGRAHAARLAADAAARGVRPDVIWHSGKLRARQTAEAYWKHCNPLADFSAIPAAAQKTAQSGAVLRYAAMLEKHCRATPYNWFNFFDFWAADDAPPIPGAE